MKPLMPCHRYRVPQDNEARFELKPKRLFCALLSMALSIGLPLSIGAADRGTTQETASDADALYWSQWRGASRSGRSRNSPDLRFGLPEEGLMPVWQSEQSIPSGNQGGWSSPIVDRERVYLYVHAQQRVGEERQYRETVYAWDRHTGEPAWTYSREGQPTRFPPSGTPSIVDQRLYFLGAHQTLVCLDTRSGDALFARRITEIDTDEPFHSSVVLADGIVAVHLDRLYGLDAQTGEVRWECENTGASPGHASPVVWRTENADRIICHSQNRETICVDAATGELVWRIDSQAGFATPVLHGQTLITYGQSRRGGIALFDLTENPPVERWRNQEFADAGSSPLVIGDELLLQGGRRLAALSLDRGEIQWEYDLDMPRPRYSSLIGAGHASLYAFTSVLCFSDRSGAMELLFDARIDRSGRLATEAYFREKYSRDEDGQPLTSEDQRRRVWRNEIEQAGPLPCCTPVLDSGMLIIRLRDRVAVYDLRRG